MLIGAVDMSPEDNDYLFRKGIIFRSDDDPEVKNLMGALLKGVAKGEFSAPAFRALASATLKGMRLEKHYRNYPETPESYAHWEQKALKLWEKAGSMADNVRDA